MFCFHLVNGLDLNAVVSSQAKLIEKFDDKNS
jgi:hypothetical protein